MSRILAILLLLLCPMLAHSGQLEPKTKGAAESPENTLNHYLQLRLLDSDWKVYSAFITWQDEPSWDCKWVAGKYAIGQSKKAENDRIVIPVMFKRLGLYCYDFDLSPGPKEVSIDFQLVKRPGGWKIDGPTPDYPDIAADTLKKSLAAAAENPHESPERRAQFSATLRKLLELLAHQQR